MSAMFTEPAPTSAPTPSRSGRRWLLIALAVLLSVATVRVLTGTNEIDSPGSLRAALVATCPILLAALGGLWAERAGVINIGLEGQMLLGTWGAAFCTYFADVWELDPYFGLLGGILFGMLGGLLHAIATVTFGVDHIVSGVALNMIALGLTVFLAEAVFSGLDSDRGRGGAQKLTGLQKPDTITVPGVSGAANDLADRGWFVVSDLAAVVAVLTTRISVATILVFVLLVLTGLVLWRTVFGLRVRSCGENPYSAESLGIDVYRYKYIAVIISGGFAGLGGAYLALVSSPGFDTDQAQGRGYIGLAAMIFGNWRPGGILIGSGMFGYTDSLRLRDPDTVHALLLLIGFWLVVFGVWRAIRAIRMATMTRRELVGPVSLLVGGAVFLLWWALTDSVPRDLTSLTPYVVTLLVLAFAAQRLRPPKADGEIYRKGTVG